MLTWKPLHWQHEEALDLPLVLYADESWIPLRELAQSLGVPTARLTAASKSKRNNHRVNMISLLPRHPHGSMAVSRASLVAISHRITPGTNNRLLRFIEVADRLAIGESLDLLAKRALSMKLENEYRLQRERELLQARKLRAEVLAELASRLDKGEPYLELEKEWIKKTGLSPKTFFNQMKKERRHSRGICAFRPDRRDKPKKVKAVRLTEDVLHKVLDDLEAGVAKDVVGRKYNIQNQTLRDIQKRRYSTAAFSAVLKAREDRLR